MDIAEAMKSISFRYYNKYPGFEGDEFEMLDNKVSHSDQPDQAKIIGRLR